MASKVVQLRNIKRALRLEPSESINYIISGRISKFRNYKSFNFVDLIDGSTHEHLQVVIKKDILKKPELGSYLICCGNLVSSRGAKQNVEFKVNQLQFASQCDAEKYPLAEHPNKSQHTDGWHRQNLHLRPRVSHFASLLRVRSELELALHMIFKQMDFFRVHTPVLTGNDSEASSDLFMVQRSKQRSSVLPAEAEAEAEEEQEEEELEDEELKCEKESPQVDTNETLEGARLLKRKYFNEKDVFMNTSAQLHLESLAASLSRVYCLSPAFRPESSLSQRHLCEFLMLEAEESNVTCLEPLMDRVESIIKFCAQYLAEISDIASVDYASLLDKYSNHTIYERVAHSKYIRMTYTEAVKILQNLNSSSSSSLSSKKLPACHYGCDINRWHERRLLDYCNNVPIFITHYPRHLKPFYMKTSDDDDNSAHALNFDLIAPHGGEICGGSLREDNLEVLRARLKLNSNRVSGNHKQEQGDGEDEQSLNDRFRWYLELREFGTFPHGGFGLGFERLIQTLVGVNNIKDTLAFPRWPGHCPM